MELEVILHHTATSTVVVLHQNALIFFAQLAVRDFMLMMLDGRSAVVQLLAAVQAVRLMTVCHRSLFFQADFTLADAVRNVVNIPTCVHLLVGLLYSINLCDLLRNRKINTKFSPLNFKLTSLLVPSPLLIRCSEFSFPIIASTGEIDSSRITKLSRMEI